MRGALLLAALLCTAPAWAQAPADPLLAPRPVAQLQAALARKASPAARLVPRAEAAVARRAAEAPALVKRLQEDALFASYGLALEAVRTREAAAAQVSRGRHAEAERTAAQAASLFRRAVDACAPPTAERKLPEELGRTEAVAGEAAHAQGQWARAQQAYERAFAHFEAAGLLRGFRPESIGRYAQACARQAAPPARPGAGPASLPGPLPGACRDWLRRFTLLEGSKSARAQAVARHVPLAALGDLAPPAPAPRPAAAPAPDTLAFNAALAQHAAGRHAEAAAAFASLLEAHPSSVHALRARYWRGRALERAGRAKEAREALRQLVQDSPLTWYGLLAAAATGEDLPARLRKEPPEAAARDRALTACERKRVERAEAFLSGGQGALAAEELVGLGQREGPSPLGADFLVYLAWLHAEAGDDASAFQAVAELLRRKHPAGLTDFAVRLLFPPRHLPVVQRAAKAQRLAPALVLGVMKQESAFRARAVSSVGAVGLMQLLPRTADSLERGAGGRLTQVDTNVRVGTRYLRYLVDHFCGNQALALAAYNAGMGRVAGWQAQGIGAPGAAGGDGLEGLLAFVEAIPLRETRDYVSQILRNHHWYDARVLGTEPPPLGSFWEVPAAARPKTRRCAPARPAGNPPPR